VSWRRRREAKRYFGKDAEAVEAELTRQRGAGWSAAKVTATTMSIRLIVAELGWRVFEKFCSSSERPPFQGE